METKWKFLILFISLYIIGMVGVAWSTYSTTNPSETISPAIETTKIVFIMLGGLGVILPTYLNVWQSVETTNQREEEARRSKIENTIKIMEMWDNANLFEARKFTRELKDQHKDLTPTQLLEKVQSDPKLRQSAILVFNYFENVRVSMEHDRINNAVIHRQFSHIYCDMYSRFKPWIETQAQAYQDDLANLLKRFQ